MEVYVLYKTGTNDFAAFLDASNSMEDITAHAESMGASVSSNTLTVDDETPVYPHEVVLSDGVVTLLTEQSDIDAAIAGVKAKKALEKLREERNKRLAETDWWASADLTMTAEQTAYRQALRDITETYSSLDDAVFPDKP